MKWRTALPRYSAGHRPTRVRKRTSGRTVTGRSKGSIIGGASGGASREEEEDDRMGEVRLSAGDLAVDDGYEGEWSVVQAGEEPTKYDNLAAALEEYDLEDDCAPPALPPPPPAFGEIVIQDSNDIHIGNKTFYNGSVTIKQFVFPKDEEKLGRLTSLTPESNGTLARSNAYLCDAPKDEKKDESKLRYLKSPYVIGAAICLALVATFLIVFFVTTKPEEEEEVLPTNATQRLVRRGYWFAKPRTGYGSIPKLKESPAPYLVVVHTGDSTCTTPATCQTTVLTIQSMDIDQGLSDIRYNFLVGGDGYIYEGLGWDKQGSVASPLNDRSLSLAFIGNFMVDPAPDRQLEAARLLLQLGRETGKLADDVKVILQAQLVKTGSPGKRVVEEIKKWPEWAQCEGECQQLVKEYSRRKS